MLFRSAFRQILDALDVHPEEAVYVGDRLWDDIHGAQQVGMRAIWIPHSAIPEQQLPEGGVPDVRPDAVAERLLDVFAIVESWQ